MKRAQRLKLRRSFSAPPAENPEGPRDREEVAGPFNSNTSRREGGEAQRPSWGMTRYLPAAAFSPATLP